MVDMKEVIWVDSLEKLHIITVPVRVEIFRRLKAKPASPKQLSTVMEMTAQNLNYHFQKLHAYGFIFKCYEERKRGAFETFYRPCGTIIRVNQRLLNPDAGNLYEAHYQPLDRQDRDVSELLNLQFK